MKDNRTERWAIALLLLLLTGLAAGLRLYRLDVAPPGLFLDEAGNGLDALDVLAGRPTIFFARSLGKEPLLNYLIVPFVALLGREPLAVRLPAALVGAATAPAVFFLVRQLLAGLGRRPAAWAGLLAAGLVAGSYWAISINRISFRANTLPLVMALAFACAGRLLRRGGTGQAITTGALFGLCFYTYLAGRFVYPLALLGLAIVALPTAGRALLRDRRRELLLAAVVCALVMAPLLGHFATRPEDFVQRARLLAGEHGAAPAGLPLARWVQNAASNVGMFGGPGDSEPRHNIPERSLLSPWLAVLFWSGLLICVGRAARLATHAGRAAPGALQDAAYAVALAWFFVMLLPSVLAVTTPRHMLRTIAALPITYFFPVVTIVTFWRALAGRLAARTSARRWSAAACGGLAALLIAGEAGIAARDYFGRWAGAPATFDAFLGSDRAIADEINRAADDVAYIVPLNARWTQAGGKYTLDFLVRRRQAVHYFFPGQADMLARLAEFLARRQPQTVRIVRITGGDDVSADPSELASLLLNQIGQRTAEEEGRGYFTEVYHLAGEERHAALPPADRSAAAAFDDAAGPLLRLTGWGAAQSRAAAAGVHVTTAGRGAVALRWAADRPVGQLLRVSLLLLDAAGYTFGQADSLLVDMRPRYSQDWAAGDTPTTYHTLIAAAGTPPGIYRLHLIVYRADTGARLVVRAADGQPQDMIALGKVTVGAALPLAPAYRPSASLPAPIELAQGVTLTGADALPATVASGLWLDVGLSWQTSAQPGAPMLHFALGERPARREAPPPLPAGAWRTLHRVPIPGDLPEGEYTLRVGLAEGETVGRWHELGRVRVEASPAPQVERNEAFLGGIRLVGWRLSETANGAEVELFWRADQPQTQDFTVFVHLLDEAGQIVAQHDAAPGNGRYATSRWPVGVVVPDRHLLPAQLHPGMGVRVGLYLAGSGVRLPLTTGGDAVEWRISH